MRPLDIDPERLRVVAQLFSEYPDLDVDRVRSLLESPAGRRRRTEPVRPRSWSEVTAAVEAGWLSRDEARKLAGFRPRRSAPARKAKEA